MAKPSGTLDVDQEVQRRILREAIVAVRDKLPEGWGATLFVSPMNAPPDETTVHYISMFDRASMLDAVKVWLKRQTH